MNNKQCWLICGFLMNVFALPVWADFGVMGQDISTEYGNAQTESFNRAITGGSSVTAEEQAQLSRMLPESDLGRYYGRFRLNHSTLIYDQLKNKSAGGLDQFGAVNKKRTTANQMGFEVAIGYIGSEEMRGDVEYLANKNLTYSASPALIGSGVPVRQVNAQIKNNTLLANVYYEFSGIYRFKPYLTGAFGASANSVQTTVLPPLGASTSNTQRTLRLAWGLGAGMRVGIFSRWFLDVSYRYINLGNKLSMQNQNFSIMGNSSMNALSLGFIYLF